MGNRSKWFASSTTFHIASSFYKVVIGYLAVEHSGFNCSILCKCAILSPIDAFSNVISSSFQVARDPPSTIFLIQFDMTVVLQILLLLSSISSLQINVRSFSLRHFSLTAIFSLHKTIKYLFSNLAFITCIKYLFIF